MATCFTNSVSSTSQKSSKNTLQQFSACFLSLLPNDIVTLIQLGKNVPCPESKGTFSWVICLGSAQPVTCKGPALYDLDAVPAIDSLNL